MNRIMIWRLMVNIAGVVMISAVLCLYKRNEKYFWYLMILGIILFVISWILILMP